MRILIGNEESGVAQQNIQVYDVAFEDQNTYQSYVRNDGKRVDIKKMPFFHFSPEVQDRLKLKTSSQSPRQESVKTHITVRPPLMIQKL